jgi:IBR domain, a half RING-finger domain
MASENRKAVAKVDQPYVDRDLPLIFFGVKHSRWTKRQLIEIIEILGGAGQMNDTKIDLYATIHDRYNPRKVLQRIINALGGIAQNVAGQSQRAQEQVDEAVEEATRERAGLAREKRNRGKRARPAVPDRGPVPELQVGNAGREIFTEENSSEEEDHYGKKRGRKGQPRVPRKRRGSSKRKADHDLDNSSDGSVSEVPKKKRKVVKFGRVEEGVQARPRNKGAVLNSDVDENDKIDEHRPLPVAFGTSTAIRDNAAFRVGLEPLELATEAEGPSCQVCADEMDSLLQFQVTVSSNCTHTPEICLSCWEQHIASQADTKSWDSIKCPHLDCGVTLDHADMQRFAPTEVFRRYDKFKTNQALQSAPGYRLCAHEGCGSGGFVEDVGAPEYVTCPDCHRHTCLRCNLAYHQEQTCDQYREWLADAPRRDEAEKARIAEQNQAEKESAKYLSKSAKTCPNGACGAQIQKTVGCDHMVCSACRYEFCWACLADYAAIRREGNHMHSRSCPYHAAGIQGH